MTFSIIGLCETTGQLGVAISSSSIAVAARCPWVQAGVGAVATQNITLPSLGQDTLELLQNNSSPEEALNKALATDKSREFRQVAVIDAKGQTAVFTGNQALGIRHAVSGNCCVAAGNLLASPDVINEMVKTFEQADGELGDRLMAAMHAAVAAGGEAGPVHSAGLKIAGEVSWPIVDLRVDWAEQDPIGQLERLWRDYKPQVSEYLARALNPTAAPSYGVPGDE